MPVNLSHDVTLTATINGTNVECQLIDPTRVRPFYDLGETVTVACGDSVDLPADEQTNGSITGEVLADYEATGISTLLEEGIGTSVPFTWTEEVHSSDGTIVYTIQWEGTAFIPPINRGFTAKRASRHDLNLAVTAESLWSRSQTP